MAAYIHGARVNVRYNGAIVGEMSEFSVTRETPAVADVEPLRTDRLQGACQLEPKSSVRGNGFSPQ